MKVVVSKDQAVTDLGLFKGEVTKTFADIRELTAGLNTGLGKIAFNPDGINFGVKSALGDLSELNAALKETKDNLLALGRLKVNPLRLPTEGAGGDPVTSLTRSVEQQKRLDDSLMASKYRNLQIGAGQYRSYLSERAAEEGTSVQRSIRLSNEMARVQLDNARRVTADLREEDAKRVTQARQAARLINGAALVGRGTAISGVGAGIRTAGQAMTYGYSMPVAAAGAYAVKTAISREDATADIAKVYPQESVKRIAQVRKDIEAISHEMPLSYQALAALGNQGGALGVPIESLKEYIKTAAQLGLVTDMSSSQATEALAKLGGALGMDVTHGTAALKTFKTLGDGLAQMGNEGAANGSEILRTAERFASAGKNAKMSAGDVLALSNGIVSLGQRAEAGGSAALSALTQMTIAAATGNKQLAQFANVAGMSTGDFKRLFEKDALGALLAFVGGLDKLQSSGGSTLKTLTDMGIKGKNELIALQNLAQAHTQVSQLRQDANRAMQQGNALQEAAAKKTGDTASQLKIMKNRSEELASKIGTDLLPHIMKLTPELIKVLDAASHLVEKFERLPEPVKQGALELLAVSVAAGPIVTVVGNIVGGVGSMARAVGFFKALKTADEMKNILSGLKGVEGGAKDAGDALGGASTKAGGLLSNLRSLVASPFKISVSLLGSAAPLLLPGAAIVGAGLLAGKMVQDATKVDPFHSPGEHVVGSGSGNNAVVATMMEKASKGVIDAGLQCGSAISKAFRENGMNVTASALRTRAEKDPRYREQPIGVDNRGNARYHEGTVFYFPKGGFAKEQHFGMAHTDSSGQQLVAEYTKAGTGKYHYRDDRPLASIQYEHGGRMEAFNAVGYEPKAGSKETAGASPGKAKFNPSLFQGNDKAADAATDLQNRLFEATHSEFQNKRYEALQTFNEDKKTDPVAAKRLYLATLKEIDKDEETLQKRHHDKTENAEATHQSRMAAIHEAVLSLYQSGSSRATRAAARAKEVQQQSTDAVTALKADPETLALDRQQAAAQAKYREQRRILEAARPAGPYSEGEQKAFASQVSAGPGAQRDLTLTAIQKERDDKAQRDADKAVPGESEADEYTKQALSDTTQLQREIWQHAGGDMKAYFASLRTEAENALAAVEAKYGPGSKTPNAAAVTAAQGEHDARIGVIGQQETDAALRHQDDVKAHDLEQNKIGLAAYIAYLTSRRDAYAQYSDEWLSLDSQIYAKDEELQRRQLDSIEEMFRKHTITLAQYQKMLAQLAAQVPLLSPVHADVVRASDGAENKSSRQMVGGQEFWDGMAQSAADNGSHVLNTLFNPRDKKSIFTGMWTDLLSTGESALTGSLSKILKNALTGSGNGDGGGLLGSLFGGLFGHKSTAGSGGTAATAATSAVTQTATSAATTAATTATSAGTASAGGAFSSLSAVAPYLAAVEVLSQPQVVAAITKYIDVAAKATAEVIGAIGKLAAGVISAYYKGISEVVGSIGTAFKGIGEGVGAAASGIGKGIHSILSGITGADAMRVTTMNVASMDHAMVIQGGAGLAGIGGGLLGGLLGGVRKLLHFEKGGLPPIGIPSLVGERGPELFLPSLSGRIFTADQTRDLLTPRLSMPPAGYGSSSSGGSRSPSSQPAPSGRSQPSVLSVEVNNHNPVYNHDLDLDRANDDLARKIQNSFTLSS